MGGSSLRRSWARVESTAGGRCGRPVSDQDITTLLKSWSRGDEESPGRLMPLVFDELRLTARGYFANERASHALQPTALVNEVFMWLMERDQLAWESRAHFFGFAAQLMRRILVDYARSHQAKKRGSGVESAPLDEALTLAEARHIDLVALDEALEDLARLDPEGSRIVEMKFFAGLTHGEIAEVLGVSTMTVRRQWTAAKLWLFRQLKRD